ncbi:ribonuclease E activity regulator RraA [Leucobacter sp. HY1910]
MAEISTADLYDERGAQLQSLALQMQDIGGIVGFTGAVRTVRCFQDNLLVRETLQSPGEGCVLVIDGAGSLSTALVGDVIASAAADNGWAGIIVNGAIRDRMSLGTLPIGVKALGSNPARSSKTGAGEVDVTVEFGGVRFEPGAQVWCDEDGVLVAKPAAA